MSVNFSQYLRDIRTSFQECHCSTHNGETIRQIDAKLPDGRAVRILEDHGGYHVSIGKIGACPNPVSEQKAEQMILEAVGRRPPELSPTW
ncbi:MAG TPA: hypothetical protein VJ785_01115 [Anaerolineales bacterium]|nr:hypothetical protein [Anaerolineales bacterium]